VVNKPTDIIGRATAAIFPKKEDKSETKGFRVAPLAESSDDSVPKIRLKAEEKGKQVKEFASASGAAMHTRVVAAKRTGLRILHKTVSLLVPKSKKESDNDK